MNYRDWRSARGGKPCRFGSAAIQDWSAHANGGINEEVAFGFGTPPLLVGVAWAAEPLSDPQMDPGTLVLQNGSVFET